MEGFPSNLNDTFTSTRGCAEPMLPMCQLKVMVTVKCQILNKQILDILSCSLYKPYTNGRISLDVQIQCCPCVSSRSRSQLKVKYSTNTLYQSGVFLPTLGKGVWSFWEFLSTKMPNLGNFVSIKWSILGKSCVHLFC